MEDMNHLLVNCDIPNLLHSEDFDEISTDLRTLMKEKGIFESRKATVQLFNA